MYFKRLGSSIPLLVCVYHLLQCTSDPSQYDRQQNAEYLVDEPDVSAENFYWVKPVPTASAGNSAVVLLVYKHYHAVSTFENAIALIEYYRQNSPASLTKGIFIYSRTYAVPNTNRERRDQVTPTLQARFDDPNWRRSEAGLVELLRIECEKRKIPLYINSSGNFGGRWQVLVKGPDAASRP